VRRFGVGVKKVTPMLMDPYNYTVRIRMCPENISESDRKKKQRRMVTGPRFYSKAEEEERKE
jgi:hypothetical protein